MKANKVIDGFGEEWARFSYSHKPTPEIIEQFQRYMNPVPQNFLNSESTVAADFGAGSGRWAELLADKVSKLYVVEPSSQIIPFLKNRFSNIRNVEILNTRIEEALIPAATLDFAMSLGVLHHIDDTQSSIAKIFTFLKPGGLFLGYMYYDLSNKPLYYKVIWRATNMVRLAISRLPKLLKLVACELIALFIYWPLSRFSRLVSKIGLQVKNLPLHQYSDQSLYMLRNDALDRFGTILEKRYSKDQIRALLVKAGADPNSIQFSDLEPFWTFIAKKPF